MVDKDLVCNKERYVWVNGTRVQVNEMVYREILAQNNRVHKKMRREKRCAQTVFTHCTGDCCQCRCFVSGCLTSLDTLNAGKMAALASTVNVEDEYIRRETWAKVFQIADTSVTDGAVILQMHIEEELTYREIADRLGIHFTTVRWRMERILRDLRGSSETLF